MKRKLIRRPKKVMLTKAIKPVSPKVKRIKIKRKQVTPLDELKRVMHRHLYLKDDSYIDVTVGAIFANQLDSKPVWIYLVGEPGTGKTDLLQAMDGHPLIKSLSKLTTKSLVSGYKEDQSRSRVKKKEEDPSLLPKLDGKNLVIKDFTPILKGRVDDRNEILGQCRDAYDGSMAVVYGTGKDVVYKSKFGLIAAVTPEIDSYNKGLVSVGERFLMTRMPRLNKEDKYRIMKAIAKGTPASKKEHELKIAMHEVLNQKVQSPYISNEYHNYLQDAAYIVSMARAEVSRNPKTRQITSVPVVESPSRVYTQMCDWARGISMARQASLIVKESLISTCAAAFDSIPPTRLAVLNKLVASYPSALSIKEMMKHIQVGESLLRDTMGDLHCLTLLELKQQGGPKTAAKWSCADDIHEMFMKLRNMMNLAKADLINPTIEVCNAFLG